MKALEIKQLDKHFGAKPVLEQLSIDVEQGEIFGYLGPNGAGKTTTIRCILDFIRPSSGHVKVLGHDAQTSTDARGHLSYLSSENHLYRNWTGKQHIEYLRLLRPVNQERIDSLIGLLDFDGTIKVHHLSTGNRQKLGIILALAPISKLLILDEPTRGLDPLLQNVFHGVLRDYQKAGGTVFMSSHNLAEVEEVCDRVAIIRAGRIISDETIQTIKAKSLYQVRLVLAKKPDLVTLESAGAQDVVIDSKVAHFQLVGTPTKLMKALAHEVVEDIEINRQTLEEMFVEMYQ